MSQEWNRTEHLSPVLSFSSDDRTSNGAQMEFKSKQWFGASVRSDGEHILVRTSHLFFPHRDGSGVNVRVSLSVCLSVSPGLRSSLSVVHIWRDRKRTCWNLFSKERRNSGGVLALQIQFVPFTYCSILAWHFLHLSCSSPLALLMSTLFFCPSFCLSTSSYCPYENFTSCSFKICSRFQVPTLQRDRASVRLVLVLTSWRSVLMKTHTHSYVFVYTDHGIIDTEQQINIYIYI